MGIEDKAKKLGVMTAEHSWKSVVGEIVKVVWPVFVGGGALGWIRTQWSQYGELATWILVPLTILGVCLFGHRVALRRSLAKHCANEEANKKALLESQNTAQKEFLASQNAARENNRSVVWQVKHLVDFSKYLSYDLGFIKRDEGFPAWELESLIHQWDRYIKPRIIALDGGEEGQLKELVDDLYIYFKSIVDLNRLHYKFFKSDFGDIWSEKVIQLQGVVTSPNFTDAQGQKRYTWHRLGKLTIPGVVDQRPPEPKETYSISEAAAAEIRAMDKAGKQPSQIKSSMTKTVEEGRKSLVRPPKDVGEIQGSIRMNEGAAIQRLLLVDEDSSKPPAPVQGPHGGQPNLEAPGQVNLALLANLVALDRDERFAKHWLKKLSALRDGMIQAVDKFRNDPAQNRLLEPVRIEGLHEHFQFIGPDVLHLKKITLSTDPFLSGLSQEEANGYIATAIRDQDMTLRMDRGQDYFILIRKPSN